MPRKKAKAQKTTKTKSGKVTQTVNVYVSKRGGGAKRPSAPRPPPPSMSDILSVIDRRQGYAFEPLVKPAAPIVPTLDPRLDAILSRFASSQQEKPIAKPVAEKPFGRAQDYASLSDLVKAQNELPNVPGGEQAFMKMEDDVLRGMGINPETGSRLPSPRGSASAAASSDIPMPFLSVAAPIEAAPIKRVPGSGKQEAVPDSGNEINMARVMKYDRERVEKLKKASLTSDGMEFQRIQQAAIKARNSWLKLNNLQEFGRSSPENVSNFKI